MRKALLWMLLGGMVYYAIEGIWRLIFGDGWAHSSMIFVGGLCFILVGGINQARAFYELSMRMQALIGSVIVLVVEFAAGYVLNLWLGLDIWDYSGLPLNVMGQVCIPFALLWYLLIPFAVWLEDRLNWVWWKAYGGIPPDYDYTLAQAYRELLTGKMIII